MSGTSPLLLPITYIQTRNASASTTLSFTAVADTTTGKAYNLSPLALPIAAYRFFGSIEGLQGSLTVAFGETPTLTANGALAGSEALSWSVSATISAAAGGLRAQPQINLTNSGLLQGTGALQATTSLDFTATATAQTGTSEATTSIAWSTSATLNGSGRLQASESVDWFDSVLLSLVEDPIGTFSISPVVLPIRRYQFTATSGPMEAAVSFAFTTNVTLTGKSSFPGNLRAFTSIADIFDAYIWLQGRGELQAAASIAFSTAGKIANNKLDSSTSIAVSTAATLTAKGQLQAADSIDFSTNATIDLTRAILGSETIAFGGTPTLTATGELRAATTIRFINPGQLITVIEASGSFGFTASGTLTPAQAVVIPIPQRINVQSRSRKITLRETARSIRVATKQRRALVK